MNRLGYIAMSVLGTHQTPLKGYLLRSHEHIQERVNIALIRLFVNGVNFGHQSGHQAIVSLRLHAKHQEYSFVPSGYGIRYLVTI